MKKLFVVVAFCFGLVANAQAQEVEVSGGVDSGRLFRDQGLVLYEDTTYIGEINVSYDGWYANLWHAETGTRSANETDGCGGKETAVTEQLTIDLNICYYEVAGPEVYQGEAIFAYALSEHWSLNGRLDVMRGGFETEVCYLGLGYARGWFDADAGVSCDTWSKDKDLQYGAGATFPLSTATNLRFSVSGFHVLEEGDPLQSDDEDGYIASARLTHNFSLN